MALTKDDLKKIWIDVQENSKKLASCDYHEFTEDTTPEKKFDKRYRCIHCGGEVSNTAKHWYEKGLAHARNKK